MKMSEVVPTVSGHKGGLYTTPNVRRKSSCSSHRKIYMHTQVREVLHSLQKLLIPDNINVFSDINEAGF